jgi:hypothetical protein
MSHTSCKSTVEHTSYGVSDIDNTFINNNDINIKNQLKCINEHIHNCPIRVQIRRMVLKKTDQFNVSTFISNRLIFPFPCVFYSREIFPTVFQFLNPIQFRRFQFNNYVKTLTTSVDMKLRQRCFSQMSYNWFSGIDNVLSNKLARRSSWDDFCWSTARSKAWTRHHSGWLCAQKRWEHLFLLFPNTFLLNRNRKL